ncbi:MAG: histidine kinase, partial [Chloroflexi bacterium]|nr:histidine kinase [Chloroflexota bacterium]
MIKSRIEETTKSGAGQSADAWERWGWVWSAVFVVSFTAPLLMTLLDERVTPTGRGWLVFLTFLSLFLHWLGPIRLTRRWPDFRRRPLGMALFMLAAISLWYALVGLHPAFYYALFGLYGQFFALLPIRWAIPLSFLLTTLVAYRQIEATGTAVSLRNPLVWLYVFVAAISVFFSLWINAIISQSARRRQLIEQLERTQADLAAAERQTGMLAERQRLAHEIHDTLAQGFTSIFMHLEAAEQALPDSVLTAQQHLAQARHAAREGLAQARRVVQDLRPQSLEEASLPEAIGRMVEHWSETAGVVATTAITGE